jgi:Leucine-rich repeat (LRR) protein
VLRDLAFHIIQSHDADEKKQLALYRPGRHLQEFPREWTTNAKDSLAVRRLSLNDNNLKTLTTNISAPNMQTLLLSHNEELEDLPNDFLKGVQQKLKVLDLSFNKSLKAFPNGFSNLKDLIYLDLGNCQGLKQFPKSICKLEKLENLHLGFCSFTKVPEALGQLKMLVVLDLGNCANLNCLPKSIGKLEMLVTLNLFQCSALKDLPYGFHNLKRLESLNLLGCREFNRYGYETGDKNALSESLRNLKTDADNISYGRMFYHARSLVLNKTLDDTLKRLGEFEKLEDLTFHTGRIKVFASHTFYPENPFFYLKTLSLNFLPNLHNLQLNDCRHLVNLTLNDCPNLDGVELTNCPNLVCLPALENFPRLDSLVLSLSIKELPRSFTRRGAFPTLQSFDLRHSGLAEFPEVEEGAMPKLQSLDFDDCTFLHTLPASISLLISIQTINLGRNEKLMTSCKTNFRNSTIRGTFIADGKPLIPEEEVSESVVPMQEATTTVRGSDKRPFQKVDGDDDDRLLKRGGPKLENDFFVPSSPKRFVYLGSSSMAETIKSEKEDGLHEAL